MYDYWFHWTDHPNTYVWAGTYQVAGMGPDIMTDDGYEPSDLILLHGPAPA